ncbi:MAG: hypothetical protein DWH99_10655 [Planctomycetota bacterium]|nr:MAG: hypothetical protein DWH99_10655 [Planctomycetota bacterium]
MEKQVRYFKKKFPEIPCVASLASSDLTADEPKAPATVEEISTDIDPRKDPALSVEARPVKEQV